jgi:O-antigen/teichoic acid export membrane protein
MIVTSLFGRLLGVLALGEYLLLRRVWAWMTTVVQLGMQVALPRYVAHAAGGQETRNNCGKYFLAAGSCMAGMIVLTTLVLNAGRREFAGLVFGDAHFMHLILPLSLLLAAYAVHGVVYGYYRGILSMGRANALAFCNYSLIPVLSVLGFYHTASTAKIVSGIGVGVAAVSCLFSIKIFRSYIQRDSLRFSRHALELIRYGIARIPGDFGAGAIFALGPIVAAHFMPLARVSSLLLGASVLVSVSVCATPLGVILLSKISMMLVQDRIADVRTGLQHMLRAVLELSVFACLQVVIFADVLIRFWVGSQFLNDLVVIRLAASAIPFYLFYVTFRTVVDAGSIKAYNARNLVISLAIFLATTALAITVLSRGHLLEGIAVAQLISIAALAFLTARSLYELYDVRMRWRDSVLAIASALLLGAGSLALHWLTGDKLHIALLVLFEFAIWPLYLGLLSWQGSTWMPFIWKTAFQERAITTMAVDSN